MKINEKINTVESSGLNNSQTFKIAATGKAFKILSSQLYSNKIAACIRELSTNAADSHVAANCSDKPFDVKLPNYLDSDFYIRDYGTGLSNKDVLTIYTTYFESNKTESNDYTGCLGLGSKSPFSYVSTFTVESFFNGKKYSYMCYMDEAGCPSIDLVDTEDTVEPNGLKVSLATKSADRSAFITTAQEIYSFFKVKPNIVDEPNFKFLERKVVLEKYNWKILDSGTEYYNRDNVYVVMGNVGYKLSNRPQIPAMPRPYNSNIAIYANIGDVDITASREDLEYTDKTNKYVAEQLKIIAEQVKKVIIEKIEALPSYFDACCDYVNNQQWMGSIQYKGKELKVAIAEKADYNFEEVKKTYRRNSLCTIQKCQTVYYSKNKYVYVDEEKAKHVKAKHAFLDGDFSDGLYLIYGDINKFCSENEIPASEITNISDLDRPDTVRKAYTKTKNKIYTFNGYSGYSLKSNLVDDLYDDKQEGVYFKIDKFIVEQPYDVYSIKNYYNIIKSESTYDKLYAIPKSVHKKVEQNPKMKHFSKVIEDIKKKYEPEKHLIRNHNEYLKYNDLLQFESYIKNPEILKIIEDLKIIKKKQTIYNGIYWLFHQEPEQKKQFIVLEKYPLLTRFFGSGEIKKLVPELGEYIEAKEKKLKI